VQTSDPVSRQVDDEERLATLEDYHVLDTAPEPGFDDIALLAAAFCRTPIALVSLVDRDRQWFKARTGLEACETPLSQSVCAHALGQSELLVIPDLTQDPRTRHNTLVTEGPRIRFYAGAPLVAPGGAVIGTLCVIDTRPRPDGLTEEQATALQRLARQVITLLEMRAQLLDRHQAMTVARQDRAVTLERARGSEATAAEMRDSATRSQMAQEAGRIGTFELDIATSVMRVSAEFCRIFGLPVTPVLPAGVLEALVLPEDSGQRSRDSNRRDGSAASDAEYRIRRASDGQLRWISRRSRFVTDGQGRPITMYGTVHDMTDRKLDGLRLAALLELGDALRQASGAGQAMTAATAVLGQTTAAWRAGYAAPDATGLLVVGPDWTAPGALSLAGHGAGQAFPAGMARLSRGEVLLVEDVLAEGWPQEEAERYAALGTRALIAVPLLVREELAGILFVHAASARRWSQEELDFTRGVADRTHAALSRLAVEAAQQVLNHELSHRLKNTLAMVQAIATQTLRPVTPRGPVEALERRIHALSAAHDVLLRHNWAAGQLRDVAQRVLGTIGQHEHIHISGPDVMLGPRCTLSFSLLLHELGTNALKYGALSAEGGRVLLDWQVEGSDDEATLVLRWREQGGPPVTQPGTASFGSKLISMGLVGTGGVTLRYPHDGFEAEMSALLVELQEP
jgi:PAS domain S-box-containing protein